MFSAFINEWLDGSTSGHYEIDARVQSPTIVVVVMGGNDVSDCVCNRSVSNLIIFAYLKSKDSNNDSQLPFNYWSFSGLTFKLLVLD